MTALPLAERELRAASSRASTHWTRVGLGFIGVAAAGLMLYTAGQVGPAFPGRMIARSWSSLLFLALLVRSVKLTADCISCERREGTLGLLFLTGLKARGIVGAKLIVPAVQSFSVVLAWFPALFISVLLGGIQLVEFLRLGLALAITVLLGLSIGVAISAFGRERRKTESTSGFVAALVWFAPTLTAALLQGAPASLRAFPAALFTPSYLHAASWSGGSGPAHFWLAVLCNLIIVGMFLAAAAVKLNGSWQDDVFGARPSWRARWREKRGARAGSSTRPDALHRQELNVNAFAWLVLRERLPDLRKWSVLAVGAAVSGLCAWFLRNQGGFGELWLYLALPIGSVLIRVLIVDEASRVLINQRSTGALEMLLATPLTPRDVIQGQWRSLTRRFAIPSGLFLGLSALAFATAIIRPPPPVFGLGPAELAAVVLALALMFSLDAVALAWTAMWLSLKCKRQADVAGSTLARILLLPDLAWLLWFIFFYDTVSGRGFLWSLGCWFCLGTVTDMFFVFWSRGRLATHFRRLASLEYLHGGPSGAWGRWLGTLYARWIGQGRIEERATAAERFRNGGP